MQRHVALSGRLIQLVGCHLRAPGTPQSSLFPTGTRDSLPLTWLQVVELCPAALCSSHDVLLLCCPQGSKNNSFCRKKEQLNVFPSFASLSWGMEGIQSRGKRPGWQLCCWEAFGQPLSCLGEHRENLGSSSVLIQDWDVPYSRRNRRGSPLPFYNVKLCSVHLHF